MIIYRIMSPPRYRGEFRDWSVECNVSIDDGETSENLCLFFQHEDYANNFVHAVHSSFEPLEVNVVDDDEEGI